MITDSCRIIRRVCRRVIPTARSIPISRVRSNTVRISVFTIPVGTLIVFVIAAIIAGLIAAIFPARRAGRLNVLEALQYE